MPFATRDDLNAVFGKISVDKWADLDNLRDADTIAARIAWALQEATNVITAKLRGGIYLLPFAETPPELVTPCARLAGVLLYDSRGTVDFDADGKAINQLSGHRKDVETYIADFKTGRARLTGVDTVKTYPQNGTY
jgi:phage gp36-like protein